MKTRTHQDVQAWPEAEEELIDTKGQWGIARGGKLSDRLLLGSFERQWEPSQSRQAIVREVRRSLLVRLHSDRTWSQRGSGNTASLDSRSTLLRVVFHFIFLTRKITFWLFCELFSHFAQWWSLTHLVQHTLGLLFSFTRKPNPHGGEHCQGLTHQLCLLLFTPQIYQRIALHTRKGKALKLDKKNSF